jgi:hypothetical protein
MSDDLAGSPAPLVVSRQERDHGHRRRGHLDSDDSKGIEAIRIEIGGAMDEQTLMLSAL